MPAGHDLGDALARARAHSPFLALQLDRLSLVSAALEAGDLDGAFAAVAKEGDACGDMAARLRRERSALALAAGIGDLAGLLPFEAVTGRLSHFADSCLERALVTAIRERTPDAEPKGFAIIALGKLGSNELNYSSDLDPIFLFDPQTLPLKPREEPAQGAVRIGQRVIELLQKREAEGYVFRIDLRLRPSPEVTPIALPINAAISHYESGALPWERAAFIRARHAAGDAALGRYFLEAIHPFVWRRSVDFGAVQELAAITRRIRDHYAGGQAFGPGYDLKRGRGGIREIEFFAQVHQLIHGGRQAHLRSPATLDALAGLAADNRIDPDVAETLGKAYRTLRTYEHRLQMVDDKQTHSLPAAGPGLDNVARLSGLDDGDALLAALAPCVEAAGAIYDGLAERANEERAPRLPRDAAALEAHLAELGFADAAAARARVEGWRSLSAPSLRSPAAADAFEAMLPRLMTAFAASPDGNRALNRFDDIVGKLSSAVNFYRLLEARPALADIVAAILAHAPALAEQLGRRPALLDGLIDESAFTPARTVEALAADYARPDRADEDYPLLLDRLRRRVNEARFALGVQLIGAYSDPLEVAGGYARVAEAAVQVAAKAAIDEFAAAHGRIAGSELVILGLGRLGGEALTHASDLDMVYLFTGGTEGISDGPKPLGATDYFNRLAPRITAALSVPTAAGPLYEVDTRLRPHGRDGMQAVSIASFRDYEVGQAWTWEHMAMTRARPVFGSAEGRAEAQAALDAILAKPRDKADIARDSAAMRAEIAEHKRPKGSFDIKLSPGGLVDLEFIVQTLQLQHQTAFHPQLDAAIDALAAENLLPANIAGAHVLLTRMLVTLRLVSPESEEPAEASRFLVAKVCGHGSWDSLAAAYDAARQHIAALWSEIAQQKDGR